MFRWRAATICSVILFAASASREPTVFFSTFLGVADCDGIAAWKGDAFLACHSPESSLPGKVQGGPTPLKVMSGYVIRLNIKTGKLIYATRVGGGDFTGLFRIKVDPHGFAYAVGFTKSHDFPTTPDAVQRIFGGGDSDAILVKVAPAGRIVYSTFLGGSGGDQGNGLELDGNGGVFVGGTTWSNDFPGKSGTRSPGGADAFVSHVIPTHADSLRSVIFGGQEEEKLSLGPFTGELDDRQRTANCA
jgi:hypothetical protein